MLKIKKNLLILTVLISIITEAFSQERPLPTVNTMSVNSASLGKYVDFPVNLHTGVPQVNLPIYNVKEGPLTLPISLSYHAGGLKVLETASWVGAGWSLNAGGMVSRTVRGNPDEFIGSSNRNLPRGENNGSFYKSNGFEDYWFTTHPDGTSIADIRSFGQGIKDGEPDLFFFNFAGYSGKFYFNQNKEAVLLPKSDVKIEVIKKSGSLTSSVYDFFQGFKITVPDGTKYYFGITTEANDVDPIETSDVANSGDIIVARGVISSWYLYQVESADSQFRIDLSYERERYAYYSYSTNYCVQGGNCDGMITPIKIGMSGVRLKEVTCSNGKVSFVPEENARQDLTGFINNNWDPTPNTDAFALDKIRIESNISNYCREFDLDFSYFQSPASSIPNIPAFASVINGLDGQLKDDTRLKLVSLQEKSCDGTESIPAYHFSYYDEGQVPRRLSFGQDHWGFINGVEQNSLVPDVTAYQLGADREPSWPAMRAGTLSSIQYPTGGASEFEYEPNTVLTYNQLDCELSAGSPLFNIPAGFASGAAELSEPVVFDVPSAGNYHLRVTSGAAQGTGGYVSLNGSEIIQVGTSENLEDFIFLQPGEHAFRVFAKSDGQSGNGVHLFVSESDGCAPLAEEKIVGGLRTKRVSQKIDGEAVSFKSYTYLNANLYSIPVYASKIRHEAMKTGINPSTASVGCKRSAPSGLFSVMISPGSIQPMVTAQGYHIGYGLVEEMLADGGVVKHHFAGQTILPSQWDILKDISVKVVDQTTCPDDYPQFPAIPHPYDFTRGNIRKMEYFNSSGTLLKEVLIDEHFENIPEVVNAVVTGQWKPGDGNFLPSFYHMQTAKKAYEKRTERIYDQVGTDKYHEVTSSSVYGSPYHQMITSSTQQTNGGTIETRLVYPEDVLYSCDEVCPECYQQFLSEKQQAYDLWVSNRETCSVSTDHCDDFRGNELDPTQGVCDSHCRLFAYREYLYALHDARTRYKTCQQQCFGDAIACNSLAVIDPSVSALNQMIIKNQVGFPLESTTYRDGRVIGSRYYDYTRDTNDSDNVYLTGVYGLFPENPLDNFVGLGLEAFVLTKSSVYEPLPENRFKYEAGNLVEIISRDGTPTSYIWGYSNTLPIVKAVGVDHVTLKAAYTSSPNNLRDLPVLNGVLVYTYEYDPLIGLISETGPSGLKTSHQYDSLGRLIRSKDFEGNILKEYQYYFDQE